MSFIPGRHMLTTLVDTKTLALHQEDSHWVIFDCRFVLTEPAAGARAYAEGHIPGARYAHLDEDLSSPVKATSGRHPLPHVATLAGKLGQWGVDANKQVVVYDDSFGSIAARLWWLLRWLGHKAVAVLDGGFPRWQREGFPLTMRAPSAKPTVFRPHVDNSLWVRTDSVLERLGHRDHILIDARAPERFNGEIEPLDTVAGHIPGSVNHPFQNNLDRTGCFLPAPELRQQFSKYLEGIGPDRVISSCGSGVTACHNILAMEYAGLSGSRLYAGSWSEWIRDGKRPIAKANR